MRQIVEHVKSQGIFDQFRRDCIEELEQKESYRQLKQRVESHVATFLSKQTWSDVLPKNQVRDSLRKHVNQSDVLDRGVKQLISQAVESKAKAFHTRIEGVVQNYLYMQNNPQKQDKQPRKHKMVDGKEETKLSTPEVISDISQLIPVPSSSSGTGSKTSESLSAEKGKLGSQELPKGGTASKFGHHAKKTHSAQAKPGVLARADEGKSGNPSLREKDTVEDSSKTKETNTKTTRAKVESLNREEFRQITDPPNPNANFFKIKDEKTRISRVKVERSYQIGGRSSPVALVVEDSGNVTDDNISTCKETCETLVHTKYSTESEISHSQADVAKSIEVKVEKTNDIDDSTFCSAVKAKDEKTVDEKHGVGGKTQAECKEKPIFQLQWKEVVQEELKFTADLEKEQTGKLPTEPTLKLAFGAEKSGDFLKTIEVEQKSEEFVDYRNVNTLVQDVGEDKIKEFESSEKVGNPQESETAVKLEAKAENNREGKEHLKTESSEGARGETTADHNRKELRPADSKSKEEVPALNEFGDISKENSQMLESQNLTMLDEKDSPNSQNGSTARDESASDRTLLESSSVLKEITEEVSSTGESSDGESDISEVSSVHTSDLSSFDEEISSTSESYEEREGERACVTGADKRGKNEDQDLFSAHAQEDQESGRRRSTRISSRRSTKEGESEMSDGEGRKVRQRRHSDETARNPRYETGKGPRKSGTKKRGRGRPRKDERRATNRPSGQMRRPRARHRDGSGIAVERREGKIKRSQRTIKRTRCYSPSSEGTREVSLPRKRSRDGPS